MRQEQSCWAALSLHPSAAHCLEPTAPTAPAGDSDESNETWAMIRTEKMISFTLVKASPVLAWADCDWYPALPGLGSPHDATCPWAGPAADTADEAVPALMQEPGNQQNTAAGGPQAAPSVPGGPGTLDFSPPTKTNKQMRIYPVSMKGNSGIIKCLNVYPEFNGMHLILSLIPLITA